MVIFHCYVSSPESKSVSFFLVFSDVFMWNPLGKVLIPGYSRSFASRNASENGFKTGETVRSPTISGMRQQTHVFILFEDFIVQVECVLINDFYYGLVDFTLANLGGSWFNQEFLKDLRNPSWFSSVSSRLNQASSNQTSHMPYS